MRIAVSGSHGLIGSALTASLRAQGHEIHCLVRKPEWAGFSKTGPSTPDADKNQITWSPGAGAVETAKLEGIDAVVHLAGENIFGRWTRAKKERIYNSRIQGTRRLFEALAGLDRPPAALAAASAIGYYGDRGHEVLTEESPPGAGFLAQVCQDWEAATEPAAAKGIRVINLRFGIVLSAVGGTLALMRIPFKLGLGGRLGNGQQYMPWVAIEDAIAAIEFALSDGTLRGPVNVAAPEQVTNGEFTRMIGKVLARPTVLPVPVWALRLAVGEMADALTASARIEPKMLADHGFAFKYPKLEAALRHAFGM